VKARVFLRLRLLEGTEDFIPDGYRVRKAFQSGRKFFKLVVPKVAVAYPRCQNQIVVWHGHSFSICRIYEYAPPVLVHAGDLSQDDRGVLLVPKNPADRGGNLARCKDRDGHLIEQRLKQVVVGAVHQHYARWRLFEGFGRSQASKPSANDDNAWGTIIHARN